MNPPRPGRVRPVRRFDGRGTTAGVLRPAVPWVLLFACVAACAAPVTPAPSVTPPGKAKEGQTCGTIRGIVCEDGLWCDPRPGACRGADLDGTCVKVPEICTQEYAPVCGCDGKTYGNDCQRKGARVAKDHDGECVKK